MKIYGIDVSHHQGDVDWRRTAAELRRVNGENNPGFAILRAGYSARHGKGGLYADGQILDNIAGCEKHGVPMGIYFYSYDESPEAAKRTAQQVLGLIKGHRFGYPIYLDMEYEPFNTGREKIDGKRYPRKRSRQEVRDTNTAMIRAALEEFERAGYYAAVYCSCDFFQSYTNLGQLAGFDKWEAAYTARDTDAVENGLWQYSSSNPLRIAGFGDRLDCDVAYKDYPAIMAAAGLNGYPAGSDTHPEMLYTLTVGPMTAGDRNTIKSAADKLALPCTEEAQPVTEV